MTDEGEREISTANAIVPSNHICKVILQPSYLGTLVSYFDLNAAYIEMKVLF